MEGAKRIAHMVLHHPREQERKGGRVGGCVRSSESRRLSVSTLSQQPSLFSLLGWRTELLSSISLFFYIKSFFPLLCVAASAVAQWISRLSQDLAFFFVWLNSLVRKDMARRGDCERPLLEGTSGARSVSEVGGASFRRIWLRIPTSSSSTRWLRAADVSSYLQSYFMAMSRASATRDKVKRTVSEKSHSIQSLMWKYLREKEGVKK